MSLEESPMEEELDKGGDESFSSGSTSPEGMSDEEAVDEEKITALEEQVRSNPFAYDPHVNLIALLRKTGDLDKLRKAREEMSKLFPLTADLWHDWLADEEKLALTDAEKDHVTALYERAVRDYMSVSIWLDYGRFLTLNMKLNEDYENIRAVFERALIAVGIHVTHGSLIWHAYRDFEKVILCSLQASSEKDVQAKEAQIKEQKNRIFNLYKRQLSVPLFDMERTYEECAESFKDEMNQSLEQVYQKAKRKLDELRPYEDALLESEAPHSEEFKQYIAFEKKNGEPVRIQNIYERALVENCLVADLWQSYCKYLDTQIKIGEIVVPVHERAVRNCPWSVQLWISYLKALERHGKPHDVVKDAFERALQVAFSSAEDYKQLWITYLDHLRRQINWAEDHDSELKILRNTFQAAVDHLITYFKDSDTHCAIMKYWAKVEAKYCSNMSRARELWNNVMSSGHSAEAQEWLQYAYFEKLHGDVKHYRKVLFKALYAASDWPEMIGDELITFEREEGTLETLDVATEKYENQFQRIQERRQKAAEKESEREKQEAELKKQARAAKKAAKLASIRGQKVPQVKPSTQEHSSDEDIQMDSEGFKIPPPPPRVQPAGQVTSSSPVKLKREKVDDDDDEDDDEFEPESKRQRMDDQPSSHGVIVRHDSTKDDRTVFLSNLAYSIDEDTIKEKFSEVGEITEVRLVKDYRGRSKGFCYVVFSSQDEASQALKKDRELLDGRPMFVSPCEDRKKKNSSKPMFKFGTGLEKNKLFVKGLPFSTTQAELEEIFRQFGDLKEVRLVTYRNGHSKGLAYVEFQTEAAATSALVKTDGSKVGDHIISVAISNPPTRKSKSEFKGVTVSDSLGGGTADLGPRGRGRTQVSLLPRALQRPQAQPKPSSSRDRKFVQNGSDGEAPSSNEPKKMSNADFRNLLLRK